MQNSEISKLLIDSLKNANLLCTSVGEFEVYDKGRFSDLEPNDVFNFEQKLGHLYEDVLYSLLEADPDISELKKSIQVFGQDEKGIKRTLGEFDYLFIKDGKLTHLELSVKFYMAVNQDGKTFWYGPDPRDHWELKREKMLQSQLLLKDLPESEKLVSELYNCQVDKVNHLVYGCVFDRLNELPASRDTISENAERGLWMKRSEVCQMFKERDLFYIPKTLWSCPLSINVQQYLTKMSSGELVDLAEERCIMFTDGMIKYFVVSDHWVLSVNI